MCLIIIILTNLTFIYCKTKMFSKNARYYLGHCTGPFHEKDAKSYTTDKAATQVQYENVSAAESLTVNIFTILNTHRE